VVVNGASGWWPSPQTVIFSDGEGRPDIVSKYAKYYNREPVVSDVDQAVVASVLRA